MKNMSSPMKACTVAFVLMVLVFVWYLYDTGMDIYDKYTNWYEVEATVTDVSLFTGYGGGVQVNYQYSVDDVYYTGVCKMKKSLSEGSNIIVLYNYNNPRQSVLK